MIELNSSGEAKRWNNGDNIILGFINIQKFDADFKDSSINFEDEPFLKQTEPKEPEPFEVFKAGLTGIPPTPFNEGEFAMIYVSGWKQFEEVEYDSQAALVAIGRTNTASQTKYQNALKNAVLKHQELVMNYQARELSIEESYENKMEHYLRQKDRYIKAKKDFEDKVAKFSIAIKLYFSDHIMNEVRKTVEKTKYTGLVNQLKSMVFTGDRREGGYCKSILDHATYLNGMNLEAFIQAINQLFDMVEICGTEQTDESKLSAIAFTIERGDCNYPKRVLEQTEYDELNYDKTIEKLINAYKMKMLKSKPLDMAVEQANYSQAESSRKPKCSVCGKNHHGPHVDNYNSATKQKGASANEASTPAATEPLDKVTLLSLTGDEKAMFEEFKKRSYQEKAKQAHAYRAEYLDDSV
jgi:hypothetical protein